MQTEAIEKVIEAIRNTADLENRMDTFGGDADEDDGKVTVPFAIVDNDQSVKVLNELQAALDKRLPAPRRRIGTAELLDPESFGKYVVRHKQSQTTIFANRDERWLKAYLNFHPGGDNPKAAGWCDFIADYTAPLSPLWVEWTGFDGEDMTQDAFAQWIENRYDDIVTEDGQAKPIELLEMARSLQIHTKGTFQRKIDPTNGTYSMVCKEEHDSNSTVIPRSFLIGVPVFDGGHPYRVECRVRFKLLHGVPVFSYTMHRRVEIERDAFAGIVEQVEKDTGVEVFIGTYR